MNMSLGIRKFFLIFFFLVLSLSANSIPIQGNLVEIKILDKISAKVSIVNIEVNKSLNFDSLNIRIYACYKNPPEEVPEDFVLLKIFDAVNLENQKLIYQGWMISSSPATTPLEHPLYDLWIKSCKTDNDS